MKSNKCLFSKTLFLSNIKRFLPFTAPLLIAEIIAFPVMLYGSNEKIIDFRYFTASSMASDIISIAFAILFCVLVFSYLFKASACTALHAFPIGRRGLYVTGLLSSYVLLVVPQLIAFAAALPVVFAKGAQPSAFVLLGIVSILCVSFIAVAIAALAVMLAGNIFSAVVIYGIINAVYYGITAMLKAVTYFFGYGMNEWDFEGFELPFSPLISLLGKKTAIFAYSESFDPTVLRNYYLYVLITVVLAVIALVISYLLYKIRRLEVAGDMVSFKPEIPVFSIIVSVFGAVIMTAFLNALFFDGFGSAVADMVSFIIFSLLFFFGAQMVLRKSASVFKVKNFIIWGAAAVITLGAFIGVTVHETFYVPTKNVKEIKIETAYEITVSPEDFAAVEEIHKTIIDEHVKSPLNLIQSNRPMPEDDAYATDYDVDAPKDGPYSYQLSIKYTLKNGKTVSRFYFINQNREAKPEKVSALIDKLEEKYPPISVFDVLDGVDFTIKGGRLESCDFEADDINVQLNKEEAEKLFALCKAESAELEKGYKSSNGLREDVISEDIDVSITFTVNDVKTFKKLTDEYYIRDFADAEIYCLDDEEDYPDVTMIEFELNTSNYISGGKVEKFISQKTKK